MGPGRVGAVCADAFAFAIRVLSTGTCTEDHKWNNVGRATRRNAMRGLLRAQRVWTGTYGRCCHRRLRPAAAACCLLRTDCCLLLAVWHPTGPHHPQARLQALSSSRTLTLTFTLTLTLTLTLTFTPTGEVGEASGAQLEPHIHTHVHTHVHTRR